MDLKILEIASDTENHKVIKNHTHQSKNKNPLCGDEMEISLIIKNDIIQDIGYQCKSCVYAKLQLVCSLSMLCKHQYEKISDFVSKAEFFFDENFDQLKNLNIKGLKEF